MPQMALKLHGGRMDNGIFGTKERQIHELTPGLCYQPVLNPNTSKPTQKKDLCSCSQTPVPYPDKIPLYFSGLILKTHCGICLGTSLFCLIFPSFPSFPKLLRSQRNIKKKRNPTKNLLRFPLRAQEINSLQESEFFPPFFLLAEDP